MSTAAKLIDIATGPVESACRHGVEQAEVYLRYGAENRIIWSQDMMSRSNGQESNLALRVWANGRTHTLTTNDLSPSYLAILAQQAAAQLQQYGSPGQPYLPPKNGTHCLPDVDDGLTSLTQRTDRLQQFLAEMKGELPVNITLNASYVEKMPWTVLVNSYGFTAAYQAQQYRLWVWIEGAFGHMTATTASHHFAGLDLAAVAKQCHERIAFSTHPPPQRIQPNGRYPVLFCPTAAADLARTLGLLLTGENALHTLPALRQRLNSPIAASALTLVDDATSRPIDDEGTPTEVTPLIRRGILKALLHTRTTAACLDQPTNGKARRLQFWQPPHSTPGYIYIEKGEDTPETLQRAIGTGLTVTGVLEPGRIQGKAGQYTTMVQGYWLEKGQFAGAVLGISLSLNIFTLLHSIRGCGNDWSTSPLMPGAGAPSLLIQEINIGAAHRNE